MYTYRRMNRLSLFGQSVDPNPRDILLFTSTSKLNLRGRQHQGALPISGSWGAGRWSTTQGSKGSCSRCVGSNGLILNSQPKTALKAPILQREQPLWDRSSALFRRFQESTLLAMARSDMSPLKSIAPESRTEKASSTPSLLKVFHSRKQVAGHGATTRFGTARSVARFSLSLVQFFHSPHQELGYCPLLQITCLLLLVKVSIAVTKLSFSPRRDEIQETVFPSSL